MSELEPVTNNTVYKTGHNECCIFTVGRQTGARM